MSAMESIYGGITSNESKPKDDGKPLKSARKGSDAKAAVVKKEEKVAEPVAKKTEAPEPKVEEKQPPVKKEEKPKVAPAAPK